MQIRMLCSQDLSADSQKQSAWPAQTSDSPECTFQSSWTDASDSESSQDIPTAVPPRRALPVTTVRAHPAFASCQVLLSNRPLTPLSPLLLGGRPAMAALGSNFSPADRRLVHCMQENNNAMLDECLGLDEYTRWQCPCVSQGFHLVVGMS